MYGEVFVSTISLVFLLLMAFLKFVAKIVKLYIRAPPTLVVDLHSSYNYLASAEWRSYTSLTFFEDSRQMPGVCSP